MELIILCLHPEVWQLEYPHHVRENDDGTCKEDEDSPLRVDLDLALQSEPGSSSEAVRLAELL